MGLEGGDEAYCTRVTFRLYVEDPAYAGHDADDPDASGPTKIALDLGME